MGINTEKDGLMKKSVNAVAYPIMNDPMMLPGMLPIPPKIVTENASSRYLQPILGAMKLPGAYKTAANPTSKADIITVVISILSVLIPTSLAASLS
jgi:hypothetical protein